MAKNILHGIPISGGIAIGRVVLMEHYSLENLAPAYIEGGDALAEQQRFNLALHEAEESFKSALQALPAHLTDEAGVIAVHSMICQDPRLKESVMLKIEQRLMTAERALQATIEEICQEFLGMENEYIRERAHDLRLVGERIMDKLIGNCPLQGQEDDPVILMARDLSPADTIELSLENVLAMVTEDGGKTSHAGILARSMSIPAVVGVAGLQRTVNSGDIAIVDGLKGSILINPSSSEQAKYAKAALEFENYKQSIGRLCCEPADTTDGHRVEVLANVGWVDEVPVAISSGAEGVGLYRTEFSFMNRTSTPSEAELYREYSDAVSALAGQAICFRTLDLGSDKLALSREHLNEANPALGLRAVRYCLRNPGLFRRQLRALLRASAGVKSSLMFPLVADLKELRQIAQVVGEVRQELADSGEIYAADMSMGIMVELPSTVIMCEALAREVDFFSIGTNDLIQYTLGVDRGNAQVSHLYQPLHPTVLRSIKQVVDVAHRTGIAVNVCGEMAADPYCLPVLLGMPVDTISMSPQAIAGIKNIIRRLNLEECLELVREVLKCDTTERINRMVKEFLYSNACEGEDLSFHFSLLDGGQG